MTLNRNTFPFSSLCVAVGLIAIGCSKTETPEVSLAETNTALTSAPSPEGCAGCCSETTQETVICAKCGQEKPAGANAEGCSDCPDGQCTKAPENTAAVKPTGCCGKCAEEKTATKESAATIICAKCGQEKPAGCCGKCAEENSASKESPESCKHCAEGDSANCKCESEAADDKSVEGKSSVNTEETDSPAAGQPGQQTSNFAHDRDVFHFLLSNNDKISRTVTELKNGVETLTESSDPTIVARIQEHVAAMYQRVENNHPIRMRDPLYREVFKHTDKINMKLENTAGGIRVTETSDDEYVVKVIQAHAKVVSGFVEHGFEEAHKNHAPPQQ